MLKINPVNDAIELRDLIDARNCEAVKAFMGRGHPVDARDENDATALLEAAGVDLVEIVDFLITAGADVEAENFCGLRPLMGAAMVGRAASLRRLLSAGVELDAATMDGETALMLVMESVEGFEDDDSIDGRLCLEMLLEAGCVLDLRDKDGRSALEHARSYKSALAEAMILVEAERRALASVVEDGNIAREASLRI